MRIYRKQRTLWRIGILPFVDMLVLVAAALQISAGPTKPEAPSTTFTLKQNSEITSQSIPVTISIEEDGTIYLDGIPTDSTDLEPLLSDALRISNGTHISIEPVPGAGIGAISTAVKAAKFAGAESLSLVVENTGPSN